MKIFNRLSYIFLYLLGFIIIGVTSFITGDIGLDSFKDASYYIDNLLTYVAIICIIVATLLKIIDDFEKTNVEYLECQTTISEFARGKTFVPSILSKYCEILNIKRKEKQFIHNLRKEFWKIDKYATDQDFHIWNHGTEEEKLNNEYCRKRKIIEEKLTREWLDKNLPLMRVEYDKITSGLILGGYFSDEENSQANEFITKHKAKRVAKDKLSTLLLSFGISSFASCLVLNFEFTASGMINVIVKCLILCWHTFMTIRYANDWTIQVTLKDIRFRKGLIQEYEKWIIQEVKAQEEAKQLEESKQELSKEVPNESI